MKSRVNNPMRGPESRVGKGGEDQTKGYPSLQESSAQGPAALPAGFLDPQTERQGRQRQPHSTQEGAGLGGQRPGAARPPVTRLRLDLSTLLHRTVRKYQQGMRV